MRPIGLILLLVTASAFEFSFDEVKHKFVKIEEIQRIYDPFVDAFTNFADLTNITYSRDICLANRNLSINFVVLLQTRFKEIDAVLRSEKLRPISDALLNDDMKYILNSMDDIYDIAIDQLFYVVGPQRNNNLPNRTLRDLHKQIIGSRKKKSESLLKLLKNYYSSTGQRKLCRNVNLFQTQLYYLYLRLATSEIIGFLTMARSFWFHTLKIDKNHIDDVKFARESSLSRIQDYINVVHKTMDDFTETCECGSESKMTIYTNDTGLYEELYPINPTKELLFYTNATRSVCIHLATGRRPTDILFDICLRVFMNTHHIIRKNKKVIKTVKYINSWPTDPEKFHLFKIKWSKNNLMVERTGERMAKGKLSEFAKAVKVISLNSPDNDLSKITHYTVTSPFSEGQIYWQIINVPTNPTIPSHLLERIKRCK